MNNNSKTVEENLTWSHGSDDLDGWIKSGYEFPSDNDHDILPNWAKRVFKTSPLKATNESQKNIFPFSLELDHHHHHSVPRYSPDEYLSSNTHPTTTQISQQEINFNRQQDIQTKTIQSRPRSEVSLPISPSPKMNFSMDQSPRNFSTNPRDDKYSCDDEYLCDDKYSCDSESSYNQDITPRSLNCNNNSFHNEVSFNNTNGYHPHIDLLYRHNGTPSTNIYHYPGHNNNNYNRSDNNCIVSSAYHQAQPSYLHTMQAHDGILYSQNRPLMSSQPQHSRIYYPYHQTTHPFQIYPSSIAQNRTTNFYIPQSSQHFYPQTSSYKSGKLGHRSLDANISNFSSVNDERPLNLTVQSMSNQKQGFLQDNIHQNLTEDNRNMQHSLPIRLISSTECPRKTESIFSQSRSTNNGSKPDEKKQNLELQESPKEIKSLKDAPIYETGKPNIHPSTPSKNSPKPVDKETPDTSVNIDKDDRSPVAYTIMFPQKEETSKPPELSDKRFTSRTKSQDRTTTVNKLCEVKKQIASSSARGASTKTKVEKMSDDNREKSQRRSRAIVKSSEVPQHFNNQMLSQSYNESYLRDNTFQINNNNSNNNNKTNNNKPTTNNKTNNNKSSQLKKQANKLSNDDSSSDIGDCDAISESGTYVVDGEYSLVKGVMEDIPDVFGLELEDNLPKETILNEKAKLTRHKSSDNSVDTIVAQKKKLREISLEDICTPDKFSSSKRLLPEAPGVTNTPEKIVAKKKPLGNENYDIVSQWLNNSVTNKPPPSTNNIYSPKQGFELEREECFDQRRGRRSVRLTQNNKTSQVFHKDPPRRDITPFREISGRRSVDPQVTSIKSRVARLNKNSSLCDGDEMNTANQMSKSLISSFDLNVSPPMNRPTRPRSTSRPKLPRAVIPKKPNEWNTDISNDFKMSKSDQDSFQKTKHSVVSERLCAPTIATELKSKKYLTAREPTPTILNQQTPLNSNFQRNNSSEESITPPVKDFRRKRISRSKTLDYDEIPTSENNAIPRIEKLLDNEEDILIDVVSGKCQSGCDENSTNISQKVAELTERFRKDTAELLKDSGNSESSRHPVVEEMLSHLKDQRLITDVNVLAAVSNLLKLQTHSNDKNVKMPAKKYQETTF